MTSPRAVLAVVSSSGLGGAERYAASSFAGLAEAGVKVHVACPEGPMAEAYAASAASLTFLRLSNVFDAAEARKLGALAEERGADVVTSHLWNADVLAGFGVGLARRRPLVSTVYGAYHLPVGERGLARLRRAALSGAYRGVYRLFDRIIAVSEYVRRDLAGRGGLRFDSARIRVVEPALGPTPQAPRAGSTAAGALKDPGGPRLVCVANFFPIKGQRTLLRALPALLRRFPGLTCRFVGDGPDRQALERLRGRLGVERSALFLGSVTDPKSEVEAADVLVLPSLSEGLPHAILEAWAFGTPVVASEAGGIPEAVVDELSGLLVPPGEPEPLAQAVGRALSDPSLRVRLAEGGRAVLATRFNRRRCAERTLEVLREAQAAARR